MLLFIGSTPTVAGQYASNSINVNQETHQPQGGSGEAEPIEQSVVLGAEVRAVKPRDIALHKKLTAACKGTLITGVSTSVTSAITNVAASAIRKPYSNIGSAVKSSFASSALQFSGELVMSAIGTTLAHHLSSCVPCGESTEKETLDRTTLISAALSAGSGLLFGIGSDLLVRKFNSNEITTEAFRDSLIDQVISNLVAGGLLAASSVALYKNNKNFRNMIDNTMEFLGKSNIFPSQQNVPSANVENTETVMEEGRVASNMANWFSVCKHAGESICRYEGTRIPLFPTDRVRNNASNNDQVTIDMARTAMHALRSACRLTLASVP